MIDDLYCGLAASRSARHSNNMTTRNLTLNVAALDECIEKVKALSIKARGRQRMADASEQKALSDELEESLRQIISLSEDALASLKQDEEQS